MPEKSKPIYYTDSLAAAKRFEEVKSVVERRKRVDELMELLPQGHLSGLNADTIDNKHFKDLIEEVLKAIQQQLPRTIAGSGGRGAIGPPGLKGDKGDPGELVVQGGIPSEPPTGKKRITNIYWDEDTQEIVIEHEV